MRNKFALAIQNIKSEAPKKTKKYQIAAKIQAHIRGFLFRLRRKRALERLNVKKKPSTTKFYDDDLIFQKDEDFDADKFFGIKQENFESALSLP